jgi:hypothetical protein
MAIFLRALTYATLFVGLVLIFLPEQILAAASVTLPLGFEAPQLAGMLMGALGGAPSRSGAFSPSRCLGVGLRRPSIRRFAS